MKISKITPEMYNDMSKQASPKSKSWINIPVAFLTGGAICLIGQIIFSIFQSNGFEKTECSTWTSVILVLASALLTGFGLYEKLAKHAGAGTLVPITGFANAVVSSALESKTEGYVLGVGVKIFTIAGPVILYGTSASFAYGLIYYFFLR
ncbi:MAG: stage V sporulation protein AC [Oscillospiraceae bacterium]